MEGMFHGCSSLESIDFSGFKAPLLTNLNKMFFHCSSIKSIDLSNFESQSLSDIECLFCGCSSLQYLDISGMNFSNIKDSSNIFFNTGNLKYVNLNNILVSDIFLKDINGEFGINNRDELMVCQNSSIITNPNYEYLCCKFNIEVNDCDDYGYIKILYKDNPKYNNGFAFDNNGGENKGRAMMFYLKYQTLKYKPTNKLEIKDNTQLEIRFPFSLQTLESFFDANYDENVK